MNYAAIMEQIKKGLLKPLYLLYGAETYLARKLEAAVINKVLAPHEQDTNLIIYDGDPAAEVLINSIETVPFMGGKNVIIVRNTELFRTVKSAEDGGGEKLDQGQERLLAVIGNMPEYSHVIWQTAGKVDKRRKIYKAVEKIGAIIELDPPRAKDVRGWIQDKVRSLDKKMSSDALEYLLGIISVMPQISLAFLDSELEKIALYIGTRTRITQQDMAAVLAAVPEVSVFAMIDAVSQRHVTKALTLLAEQLGAGEHPLKIIALLARQVRLLWQAKELAAKGINSRELAGSLGVPAFIGEKMLRQSNNFTVQQLKQAALSLAEADRDFKNGQADRAALEQIVIDMCRQY